MSETSLGYEFKIELEKEDEDFLYYKITPVKDKKQSSK